MPLSAGGGGYLQELQQQAREQTLAADREWLDLLHYGPRRWMSGEHSRTAHPGFFNADHGERDPAAELDATLAAFFRDAVDPGDDREHPQCTFIARYHWLNGRLDFDPERLPPQPCPRFQEWFDAIDPQSVTLIFADAYMNNPASLFGHTLLRVDGAGNDGRLLSYVVNHAAATTENSGLLFAVRGLTGAYPGLYSIMPYYEKVREYSNMENRDLWEYELALTPVEVERLMMHVWELRETPFPYYFLYQNCSYRLLQLLDVARPGMDLSSRFLWWAVPTDTVRVVLEEKGMLREAAFRPASRTRLEYGLDRMPAGDPPLVLALAGGELEAGAPPVDSLPAERRGAVLESAHDLLHYRFMSGDQDDVARARLRSLLVARSRIRTLEPAEPPPAPETRPDQGHGTLRLGAGGGTMDGDGFIGLHWRPAYHDLLDPPGGYRRGAHISFLDTRVHYLPGRGRLLIDRLRLVDIESLAPRDPVFRSWSWHVGGGLEQRLRPGGGYGLMAGLDGGGGGSWALGADPRWLLYAGLSGAVWAASRLDDGVRAGLGPRLDLLYVGERWRGRLRGEVRQFTDDGPGWRLAVEQDLSLAGPLGLRLSVAREADFGEHANRIDLTLHWYH